MLSEAERKLQIADRLARLIPDERDTTRTLHPVAEIFRARILAIADIYEALVANDRPYKEPMKLSLAMSILGGMVKRGNLDGELMKIFLESGDYMKYAEEHLNPEQIDEVDIAAWLEEYYIEPVAPFDC